VAVAVAEVFGQLLTGVGDGCGARSEAASPRAEADRGNLIWGMGGGEEGRRWGARLAGGGGGGGCDGGGDGGGGGGGY